MEHVREITVISSLMKGQKVVESATECTAKQIRLRVVIQDFYLISFLLCEAE